MAAVITGFRAMVMEGIEAIGPNNFIASRFDPTALTFSGDGQDPTEGKPPLTFPDAEMLEALPAVRTVATSIDAGGEVRVGSRAVSSVQIMGRSADWVEYSKGDFVDGRNFKLQGYENKHTAKQERNTCFMITLLTFAFCFWVSTLAFTNQGYMIVSWLALGPVSDAILREMKQS